MFIKPYNNDIMAVHETNLKIPSNHQEYLEILSHDNSSLQDLQSPTQNNSYQLYKKWQEFHSMNVYDVNMDQKLSSGLHYNQLSKILKPSRHQEDNDSISKVQYTPWLPERTESYEGFGGSRNNGGAKAQYKGMKEQPKPKPAVGFSIREILDYDENKSAHQKEQARYSTEQNNNRFPVSDTESANGNFCVNELSVLDSDTSESNMKRAQENPPQFTDKQPSFYSDNKSNHRNNIPDYDSSKPNFVQTLTACLNPAQIGNPEFILHKQLVAQKQLQTTSLPLKPLMQNINNSSHYQGHNNTTNAFAPNITLQPLVRTIQQHHQASTFYSGYSNSSSSPPSCHADILMQDLSSPTDIMEDGDCCSRERKKFQCPQCRYITDRKNNLMRHIVTMHEDSGKILECCGIAFQSKASLREHNSVFHSGGYRCQICNRNFCRKALLRRHLTVHSGQKDFFCHLCGYATSHKSNLERHQKVHTKRQNRINLPSVISTGAYTSSIPPHISLNPGSCGVMNTTGDESILPEIQHYGVADSNQNLVGINKEIGRSDVCETLQIRSPTNFDEILLPCGNNVIASRDISLPVEMNPLSSSHISSRRRLKRRKSSRRGIFTSRLKATYHKRSKLYASRQKTQEMERNSDDRKLSKIIKECDELLGKSENDSLSIILKQHESCKAGDIAKPNANPSLEKDIKSERNSGDGSKSMPNVERVPNPDNHISKVCKSVNKTRMYSFVYACSDCHLNFPNQILLDSHSCMTEPILRSGINISIVVAVHKGRIPTGNNR